MNIDLRTESRPWLGNPDAEVMEELHFHDQPLVTVVSHEGERYLAQCVVGEVEDVSLWAYAPLTDFDLAAISQMDESSFDEVVQGIGQRTTHVAMASHGRLVWWSVRPLG